MPDAQTSMERNVKYGCDLESEVRLVALMSARRKQIFVWSAVVIMILVAILLWQLVCQLLNVPKILLPKPSDVLNALINPQGVQWVFHASKTLYEVLTGYLLGATFGIVLAIILAYSKRLSTILYPFVLVLQLIPKVTLAPIFFVWFGLNDIPRIVLALLIAFFPILVDTLTGLNAVEPELMDLAHQLRATSMQKFRKVRFMYALPSIFSGLKTSATLAVIGALVAEFVGGNTGLGYIITFGSYMFRLDISFAAIALTTLIGMSLFIAVTILERLIIPWYIAPRQRALDAA